MTQVTHPPARTRRPRARALALAVAAVCLAQLAAGVAPAPAQAAKATPYSTALNYTIRFYPRYLTFFQQRYVGVPKRANVFTGPATMSPKYGIVVAPNDDTVYTEAFLDLKEGPQILTVPSTRDHYSLLTLDVFGNILETGVHDAGTYALVPAGYTGPIPAGVTRVEVPYRLTMWIFRADRFAANGENMGAEARAFRDSLRLTSIADWQADTNAGKPHVLPVALYGPRMKEIADKAVANAPIGFLRELQAAMHAPTTQPLSASDRALSLRLDVALRGATRAAARGRYSPLGQIIAGTRDAHAMIINRWLTHIGPTRWVHFDNIGEWGTAYLDRAALSEYIQYGNNAAAATYYNAFTDSNGVPLDGSVAPVRITFPADEIPEAARFWSITAYIPPGETLFPNRQNKWLVGSYTRGLKFARDGSLTIYIQPTRPRNVPLANWLPVPSGPYSLLFRIYGPTGNTAPSARYLPPLIRPFGIPSGGLFD